MKKIGTLIAAVLFATTALAAPGSAHTGHRDWQHCTYEDGSSQNRCVWDARHSGNGVGQSIAIRNGGEDNATYTRISHRRAKHLLGANH